MAPPARAQQPPGDEPSTDAPYSIDNVREGLARDTGLVTSLQGLPVFRLEIVERRPRTLELEHQFVPPSEPRPWTTAWHNEFLDMVTPEEARPYSPMLSNTDKLQLLGTSLASFGVIEMATSALKKWGESRRRGREAEARREVDDALRAWEAQQRAAPP